jgi:hypothetical protein
MPSTDSSQRANLPALQGQVEVQEPQEAKEEGVRTNHRELVYDLEVL